MAIEDRFTPAVLLAWQGKLAFPELLALATDLENANLRGLAIVLYQTWLKRTQSPYAHAVYFNLGAALSNENDLEGAMSAYQESISLAPAFAYPRVNLGLLYERQGKIDQAIMAWRWVETNIPIDAQNKALVLLAINHLGRVFEARKQFYDALACLTKSLELEPQQADVIHHWVYLRQKQCAWPIYTPVAGLPETTLRQATSALAMINISDDPQIQLDAARRYAKEKVISGVPQLAAPQGYGHKKIRIGYCSSDFCLHPVAMLTVQLFELHAREQFEIYGYCWSPEDGSAMRQRVIQAMDHFERIHPLNDEEAAKLIRSHEIDILIDLQGQTSGARANIFSYRPAPIQITYLGLPATTGLPAIDYVIADRYLIPENLAPFYSEKPLYMPDIYQVSDQQRQTGPIPSRASCGLPETGFVFCSFNNCSKFTPEVFDTWMRILQRVPGSVLWLLADNVWAENNLRHAARAQGISEDRIIFAGRVAPENYLARYAVADLFLDTFPFNAGTTANDALWMGLPVLTCSGRSFASRMAGALLTAAQLGSLITDNLHDYEEKAVALAGHPDECQRMREHLRNIREHGALFDTAKFVKNLESSFNQLVADL